MGEISIRTVDLDQFSVLAQALPEVKTYMRGLNPRVSDYVWRASKAAEARLEQDFPFLLLNSGLHSLSEFSTANSRDTLFVTAIESTAQEQVMVGFACLEWMPYPLYENNPLAKNLLKLGNRRALEEGYRYISNISVVRHARGRAISHQLLEEAALLTIDEAQKHGDLPSLLKISSFEPLGKERLPRHMARLAQKFREDLIIGYGGDDVHALGYWVDAEQDCELELGFKK